MSLRAATGARRSPAAIGARDPAHCAAIHLNMVIARPDPETMNDLTEKREARHRRHAVLPGLGFRLLQGAEHPAPDGRLRPGRFAGGPGCLDPGEVLGLDRLRRPPGERAHPGRDARQHYDVLAPGGRRHPPRASTGRASTAAARRRSRSRSAAASSRRRSSAPLDAGPTSASPTSSTGTNSKKAATSPPSSSRRRS